MKKTLIIACLLIVNLTSFSQINTVRDGSIVYNEANRYCVEFEVEAVPEEIAAEWKKYLKKNYKIKLKKYLGDYSMATEVIYTKVSNKTINLYSSVSVKDTTSVLKIFAAFENDLFLNQTDHATEINRLKQDVRTFLSQFVDDYYDSVLKPLLKKKKKITKDISKTDKDLAKADKKLKKNNSTINKNEAKVKSNQDKIEKYNQKIADLNTDIESSTKENEEMTQENTVTEEEVKVLKEENEVFKEKLKAVTKEIQSVESKK